MSRFIFTPKALRKNAALRPEDYFGGNSEPWGKNFETEYFQASQLAESQRQEEEAVSVSEGHGGTSPTSK